MSTKRRWLFIILLMVGFAQADVAAVDRLGLVMLESHADALAAEEILGDALGRTGNGFLVLVDSAQMASLASRGLEFDPVLPGADPAEVFRIYDRSHSRQPRPRPQGVTSEPTDLGSGLVVMPMTPDEVASLVEAGDWLVRPLTDFSVGFRYLPPGVASAPGDEFPYDYLADSVDFDSVYSHVQRLQDFVTRFAFTDSCLAARDWIIGKFLDWGYTDVTTQRFWAAEWWDSGFQYNVIAVKPGYAEPDKVIVIGGHYDAMATGSYPNSRYDYAPGADDDASGVAVTMEAARVLADIPLRKTVVFIAFAAEELGLLGSEQAALGFAFDGSRLEVMYNFDMVGYTGEADWGIDVSSEAASAYRDFSIAAAGRVTSLITSTNPMPPPLISDHIPFGQLGFLWVNHFESHVNPNAHTNYDITSQLNFEFLTDVTKMGVVSLARVADSPYPTEVERITDPGDGQSLQVSWSDCSLDCSYKLYWGTASGTYIDSTEVAAGGCVGTITGLTDGTEYHVLAIGRTPDGLSALYGMEGTGVPLAIPRQPQSLSGLVTAAQLRLAFTWDANEELDISHYNVYRAVEGIGVFALHATELPTPEYVDYDVAPRVGYEYRVTAVDLDGNESEPSESVTLYPATFDGGLVVADGFAQDHTYDPDQAGQEAWFDSLLDGFPHGLVSSDEFGGPITLNETGRYSTLVWIDDDVIQKDIGESEAVLETFAGHHTNMLISGYHTLFNWSTKAVPTSHLLYREFGLSYYDYTAYFDFIGAHGQNGWPSVQIDPSRGINEWRDIPKLTPRPGATVIGTFDSYMDYPEWEGQPVGLAYESENGKRVLLSYPLYYLTPESARNLMARVLEYFGLDGPWGAGDLDHSTSITLADLSLLLDHLFISRQPLSDPEAADLDERPGVGIGDAFVLIDFLLQGGPQPAPGTR